MGFLYPKLTGKDKFLQDTNVKKIVKTLDADIKEIETADKI